MCCWSCRPVGQPVDQSVNKHPLSSHSAGLMCLEAKRCSYSPRAPSLSSASTLRGHPLRRTLVNEYPEPWRSLWFNLGLQAAAIQGSLGSLSQLSAAQPGARKGRRGLLCLLSTWLPMSGKLGAPFTDRNFKRGSAEPSLGQCGQTRCLTGLRSQSSSTFVGAASV